MGGFLGYDPGHLTALRRAVAQALAEAATVRCDDPLAANPLAEWRRAIRVVAPWDARLGSILSCGFDSPYRPVAPSRADLPIDDVRPLAPGWTVVTDPVAGLPAAVDPLERLAELLALLIGLDPRILGDPVAVQRLLELLDATFADDAARQRFFAELGPEGFAAITSGLTRWIAPGPHEDAVASGALAVLDRLARGLGLSVRLAEVDEAAYRRAAVDGELGDPLAAALVIRGAGFPSAVTATWALDVLDRSRPLDPAGLDSLAGPNALSVGGVLLEALTADPVAGRAVLSALDELDVLLGPHLDGDGRGHFLLAVTDPARFPVADTVALLQHVLGYLDTHRTVAASSVSTRDLHDWLGICLAPYLLALVPSPSVPITGWGSADVVGLLAWVSESQLSAAALFAAVKVLAGAAIPSALAPSSGSALSRAQARMEQLGVVAAAAERGQVAWAEQAHGRYELTKSIVRFGLDRGVDVLVAVLCPPAAAFAESISVGTPLLVDAAFDELADHGLVQVPPTATEMAAEVTLGSADLMVGALGSGVAVEYERFVASGALPASGPPPPRPGPCEQEASYRSRLTAWAAGAGPAAKELAQTADAAATGFSAGRSTVPGAAPLSPPDALVGIDGDSGIEAARRGLRLTDKLISKSAPLDD